MLTKTDIEAYFSAEKNAGMFFIIVAGVAIIFAIICFFFLKTNWYKGFALPFLLIGIFQLMMGLSVHRQSDAQRLKIVYAYDMNPGDLKTKELPRAEKLKASMKVFLVVEILLFVAGLIVYVYSRNDTARQFINGVALGLSIQAIICLSVEWMAINRIAKYISAIESFVKR